MNDLSHSAPLPNEPHRFLSMALDHAIEASHHANLGFRRKSRFLHFDDILKKWEALLVNSQAVQHSALFLLFFLADILVSWEMNRDIIHEAHFFPSDPPWWAILLLCLLINGWAAVSANFFAKGWSRDIQALERWNVFYFKTSKSDPISHGQEQDMIYERRKARWYALVSSTVLFAVVALIIWHRWLLLQPAAEDVADGGTQGVTALNAVIILLPLAILLGELITGDYVWYLLQRGIYKWKRGNNWRIFLRHKRACSQADKRAFDDYQTARLQNDNRADIGEALEKSLHRIRHRALDSDGYIDPVEEAHRITFTVIHKDSGLPIRRAHVYGVLPSGAKTGDFQTDDAGRCTLSWTGNFDRLELVTISQTSAPGPFHENAEHLVRIAPFPPPPAGGLENGQQNGAPRELITEQ